MQMPPVTGVTARYRGDQQGTTNWRYWVQAIYPSGLSALSSPGATGAKALAALTKGEFVDVQWNSAPGAIGYLVWRNTTGTTPADGATQLFAATSETGLKDDGSLTTVTTNPRYDGMYVAKAYYRFADDGGLVSAIVPKQSDTIPANAIVMGAIINVPTALTSGGNATIAVGTSAGSAANSILAATAVASWSIDALLYFLAGTGPFGAAAFKMSAAGQIQLTVAVAALTAGVAEVFVFYVLPTNP